MAKKTRTNVRARDKAMVEDEPKAQEFWEIDRLSWFLFMFVPLVVTLAVGYFYYLDMMRNLVTQPTRHPNIVTQEMSDATDRLWGTYRPGLYFGTKTRRPKSIVSGLMWVEQSERNDPKIRHWCEQGDGLPHYTWQQHNGKDFGVQLIQEKQFELKTEFVGYSPEGGDSSRGGDWLARITVTKRADARMDKIVSLMYYFASGRVNSMQPVVSNGGELQALIGNELELGDFRVDFTSSGQVVSWSNMVSFTPGYERINDVLRYGLHYQQQSVTMLPGRVVPPDSPGSNLYVYEVSGRLPLTLEIRYSSLSSPVSRPPLPNVSTLVAERSRLFQEQFEAKFGLKAAGFNVDQVQFAQAALSNMIGGVGYFYGASIVQSEFNEEPVEYWQAPLLTAVPSRSFFPRGFLWDEGFHNLLIREWDEDLSMEIIAHWLDLMNTEGWIPREQILGGEARAKVPAEFIVQRNENANPPTFFLPLEKIVDHLLADKTDSSMSYLGRIYPRLQLWYDWFNKTQAGPLPNTYRWRGRNPDAVRELNPKTLTSGLDDYPRASHPTDEERHLDLRCWMALASRVMSKIAESLGLDHHLYESTYQRLSDNADLNAKHWSAEVKRYADYGLHTDALKLKRPSPPLNLKPGQPIPHRDKERVVLKEPKLRLVTSHYGYVSLFPLLTQILEPDSSQLAALLAQMRNTTLLWTQYGLRSLATSSPLYRKHNTEHDPPYWRGAIWININYLAIRALHAYGQTGGANGVLAAQIYSELRENVINNLYNEFKRTGYIWEQYDDKTGRGKGCHPFTGWSALVTLIMAEKY